LQIQLSVILRVFPGGMESAQLKKIIAGDLRSFHLGLAYSSPQSLRNNGSIFMILLSIG
jgi:hypothetical protein